ncbi:hypothetical protein ABD72_22580 [Brevibacillus laterosporus]|nr:hypothetical protein [Brevibacillus laterosporus]TPH09989.1 hypothetical protein EGH09_21795 [Brevibacillus laterosporus]
MMTYKKFALLCKERSCSVMPWVIGAKFQSTLLCKERSLLHELVHWRMWFQSTLLCKERSTIRILLARWHGVSIHAPVQGAILSGKSIILEGLKIY